MNAATHHRALVGFILASLFAGLPASADWVPNGIPFQDPGFGTDEHPQVGPGGFDGLLLGHGVTSRFCTLIQPNGARAEGWPVEVTQASGFVSTPVADDTAGAYVAIASPGLVVVRHFLFDGTADPGWPAGGVEVCGEPGHKYAQAGSDQTGGVYVMWTDGRNADPSTNGLPNEIYGTRVVADGGIVRGWEPQGTLLVAAAESVSVGLGAIRPDGAGGVFVMLSRIYGQFTSQERTTNSLLHVEPDGTIAEGWPTFGWTPPDSALAALQFVSEPDGSGGVYLTWLQPQGSAFGSRLLRLLSSGAPAPGWPPGGVPVLEQTTRLCYGKALAADGAGGVFVGAATDSDGAFPPSVNRVFHFDGNGAPVFYWPAGGRRIPQPPDPTVYYFAPLLLASDAQGGVFAVWGQSGDDFGDFAAIGAMHLDLLGDPAPGWPGAGLPVCDAPGLRKDLQIVANGSGTAYVVWSDQRPTNPTTLFYTYATRLDALNRTLTVGPAGLAPAPLRAGPNPFARTVDLRLSLAEGGDVRLDVFDTGGRVVRRVANEWLPAGAWTRTWDGRTDAGRDAPSGLYFVRGSVGGRAVFARLVRIR